MSTSIKNSYQSQMGEISWSAPSNIALVKYWGKHGDQLPRNPSLSFTLDKARTKTSLKWKLSEGEEPQLSFLFHGEKEEKFATKIQKYFKKLEEDYSFLKDFDLEIRSENTFPHSTGIASSASSMAALALCLEGMREEVTGKRRDESDFLQKSSHISRLGSGSACRSLYNQFALWGELEGVEGSSDLHAIQMGGFDPIFSTFRDCILIVDSATKAVSSTQGHALMENHPYSETRFAQARENTRKLIQAMVEGDLESFGDIVEREALELHSLMAMSTPSFILMKPNTLAIIEEVRNFRASTGHPVYFTLDAGPNVHLLYPEAVATETEAFIESKLKPFLEDGKLLADYVGKGPRLE